MTLTDWVQVAWPLSTWKVLTVAVFMVLLGVGIEIALVFSRKGRGVSPSDQLCVVLANHPIIGFPVPRNNVLSFVQPSFLTVSPLHCPQHMSLPAIAGFLPYTSRLSSELPLGCS